MGTLLITTGVLLIGCFITLELTAKNRDVLEGRPFTTKKD